MFSIEFGKKGSGFVTSQWKGGNAPGKPDPEITDVALRPSRRRVLSTTAALAATSALGGSAYANDKAPESTAGGKEKPMADNKTYRVALMMFDNMTQLDATAPYEVFNAAPGFEVITVSPSLPPVTAAGGLKFITSHIFDTAPKADILCIPGGGGVNPLMTDEAAIEYIRSTAADAEYVTSVCTGALLLGAAGLLKGRRATTHWASLPFLEEFGATPVKERVVADGNLITGGGVTAGVDFAFALIDHIRGREAAALAMLALEYDPAPPFVGGSPDKTDPDIVAQYDRLAAGVLEGRANQIRRAAAKLSD